MNTAPSRFPLVALLALSACGGKSGTTAGGDMAMKPPADMAMAGEKPDLAQAGPCKPIEQTCANEMKKCTFVDDGNMSVTTDCMPIQGAKKDGEVCKRIGATPEEQIGNDDCEKGLFCSGLGQLSNPPSRKCRKFCRKDGECGAKVGCVAIGEAQPAGLCVPSCTPFGNDCGANLTCTYLLNKFENNDDFIFSCRAVGKVAAGARCSEPTDCLANMFCADPMKTGQGMCVQACDNTHPCPMGKMCRAEMGFANGFGTCQ